MIIFILLLLLTKLQLFYRAHRKLALIHYLALKELKVLSIVFYRDDKVMLCKVFLEASGLRNPFFTGDY